MGWTNHYHPDEPLTRKMTPAQEALLRRIVATNGGGISAISENDRVIKGLIDRHLIQAKKTISSMMVHTREGLEWVRANPRP